jgi:chaperone modulatory protein CbpM
VEEIKMNISILRISVHELCEQEGISVEQISTIVEYDIARPHGGKTRQEWEFDTTTVAWIRKALRLRRDLELDWVATAMLIDLLRQRDQLQNENQRLQQQLERFLQED